MTKSKSGGHPEMKLVNPWAAAVDIGSTMHMALLHISVMGIHWARAEG